VRWNILGPIEMVNDATVLRVQRPQHQAVLAYLILNGNLVVSTGQLISALWRDAPPVTARTQIQSSISRIRQVLRQADAESLLTSDAAGYRLSTGPGEVDLGEFRSGVRDARDAAAAGQLTQAATLLRSGLRLWRGPALSGSVGAFVESAAWGLEEQRLTAIEELVDVELASGRHREVIAELSLLVHAHPLRERPVGQLMLALYRSGRQADALGVFRSLRRTLADDHGLDPSIRLVELNSAIARSTVD
jgi:DNA-binding SARP family transcriptional activator